MLAAEVGDDVFGEDPEVNALQEEVAALFGKEAALFVPSGLMGNLVLILALCGRGEEIILGRSTDMFMYEVGSAAAVGSVHSHPIPNLPDGTLELQEIELAIRDFTHNRGEVPRTSLICLENTNMLCGGVPLKPDYCASVRRLADRYQLPIHLDGERIFNAAVALDVDVKDLVKDVDAVMFGLSKGLACPVGSVICSSRDVIERARGQRKLLGGGMRQAGIVAAAGIVALEQMVDRLAEDHANASLLAKGLAEINGLSIDIHKVHTNIVFFDLSNPGATRQELVARLARHGVKILELDHRLRAVTHYGICSEDIMYALQVIRWIVADVQ